MCEDLSHAPEHNNEKPSVARIVVMKYKLAKFINSLC